MTDLARLSASQDLQPIYRHELTVEELAARVDKVHEVMRKIMRPDEHYGVIPGTKKPTLYKAGAELLCMLFCLDPQYSVQVSESGEHQAIQSTVTLFHAPTGARVGSGMGSCSTRESKYAYRKAGRTCPSCAKEDTIIKGKAEYGGGWLCFGKRGGCGAKYKDGDAAIEGQQTEERVANPDLPDVHNTVLKIANKRALIAAVLNVTAASHIFTQDVDRRDESDDDEPATSRTAPGEQAPTPAPPSPSAVISENQVKRLSAIATGEKWSDGQLHDLLAGYQYSSRSEIRREHYDAIVDRVKQGPGKAA